MKIRGRLALFAVVVAVQVTVPLLQIWRYEDILRTGRPYRFRTAPVDPADAFRGRYVALDFGDTVATVGGDVPLRHDGPAYVTLEEASDGMVRFGELHARPPAAKEYLRVEYLWRRGTNVHFRLPFDRFYMKETLAPGAERAYWEFHRTSLTNVSAWAVVRVKGGRGVIEDVLLDGRPLRQVAAERLAPRHQ